MLDVEPKIMTDLFPTLGELTDDSQSIHFSSERGSGRSGYAMYDTYPRRACRLMF